MSPRINPYLGWRECLFCRRWFLPKHTEPGQRYCKRHQTPKCDPVGPKGKKVDCECEICHLRWKGPKGTRRCPRHANELFLKRECRTCGTLFWVARNDLPSAFGGRCIECRPSVNVPNTVEARVGRVYSRPGKILRDARTNRQQVKWGDDDVKPSVENAVRCLEDDPGWDEPP